MTTEETGTVPPCMEMFTVFLSFGFFCGWEKWGVECVKVKVKKGWAVLFWKWLT